MNDKKSQQAARIQRYAHMIEQQTGKAVRPYRADGYVNLMNRYGTSKDATEHYQFAPEADVPDDALTLLYEGNGLFSKIIDAPAEEAIKHGFKLDDVSDAEVETFYQEALDELDWEEVAMTGIKWARLFGGSIAVMLINDGGGLEEPLNWKKIRSIDDIRVYDRSVIQPDYSTMFSYDPRNPFSKRGSRLGMPEFYHVNSRFGSFTVHESRCLIFQNGVLPENSSNTIYQMWGMPEYIRIHRALRDAEVAHGSGPKMLDRSVQPVYKMKDLAALLATDEGESQVLKRLQVIDLARGLLNSLVIDNEGEDYDFKTFQYTGVADVIDATCNFLSALTNIPQTILFGRSPAGMNATGESDLENWYSYCGRIQKRMIKSNLRYLLSIIFQAGVYTGEVDEVPKIKIAFNPLKVLSDSEQAELDNKKASTELIKAQTVQIYRDMEVLDSTEIRKKLADSGEFEVSTILDEYDDEEELMAAYMGQEVDHGFGGNLAESGDFDQYATGVDVEEHETDPGTTGSAPASAPAATKLPQDMSEEETEKIINKDEAPYGVGVLVVKDGRILCGTRHNDTGYGLICGPGGHGEKGETYEQSAFRETEEEFGISPKELIPIGIGPLEPESNLRSHIFLCTDFEGEPDCVDLEMTNPKFRTLEELEELRPSLFPPFADSLEILMACLNPEDPDDDPDNNDGGPGSGNWGHEGREGKVGGSAKGEAKQPEKGVNRKNDKAYQQRYSKVSESQKALMNASLEEIRSIDAKSFSIGDKSDPKVLRNAIEKFGLNDAPKVLSGADFDKKAKESPVGTIYRGVEANVEKNMSAEDVVNETLYGNDTYIGAGFEASGIYFAMSESGTSVYSKNGGETMKACIDKDAATITFDDLLGLCESSGINDTALCALYHGYEVVTADYGDGDGYCIALTRRPVIFEGEGKQAVAKKNGGSDTSDGNRSKPKKTKEETAEAISKLKDAPRMKPKGQFKKAVFPIAGEDGDPDVQSELHSISIAPIDMMEAQEEVVSIDKLRTVQLWTDVRKLNGIANAYEDVDDITPKGETDGLPIVVKYKGQYILRDGNHRATVAKLQGKESIRANVIDWESVKTDNSENILAAPEKPLDFSPENNTIKSQETSEDGAPKGNDNAAGPHKRSHLSKADKEKYTKRIVGQKTSDGVTVTGFWGHAFDRIAQRNISMGQIEKLLQSSKVSPDKTYPNRNCYDVPGKRLVLDKNTGEIVTIEWRSQNK